MKKQNNNSNKLVITEAQLKQIIQEEYVNYLAEQGLIDEGLLDSLKAGGSFLKKGAQAVGSAANTARKSAQTAVGQAAGEVGKAVAGAAKGAVDAVGQAAGDVKDAAKEKYDELNKKLGEEVKTQLITTMKNVINQQTKDLVNTYKKNFKKDDAEAQKLAKEQIRAALIQMYQSFRA